MCATDDFQIARKNVIFENCIKNLSFEKYQMFDVFKVPRPVCSRLHFDLRKHFTQKLLIFKNFFSFHFLPKNEEVKEFFPKHHQTVVHINAQIWAKNQFNIISALSEK